MLSPRTPPEDVVGSSSSGGRGRFRDRLQVDVDAVVRELRDGRETAERAAARLLFLAEAYAAQRVALAAPGDVTRAGDDRPAVARVAPIARATDGTSARRRLSCHRTRL